MSNATPPRKVGISGSYGGFNLGDEALLQVIVSELRRSLPIEVTVFSRDAQDTRRRHQVEHVVQSRDLSRRERQETVAGLDLFILGGGASCTTPTRTCTCARVLLAHETNTPVMVCAISAGPALVSSLCHGSRVALAALYELLAPYLANRQMEIVLRCRPSGVDRDDERLRAEPQSGRSQPADISSVNRRQNAVPPTRRTSKTKSTERAC